MDTPTNPDVPPPPPGRRLRARDALITVGVMTVLLILFQGQAARNWGEQMDPGLGRDLVLAFGKPVGWLADRLPLADAAYDVRDWIASEDDLGDAGGFDAPTETTADERGGIPPVSAESFDPVELGENPPKLELDKLLVTGDSLIMPTDLELARRLAGDVEVVRDPHVGTGISKPGAVDWGRLSTKQVADEEPDAVVAFIGANDGFPIPIAGGEEAACCGPEWAAAYASRVRRMMDTYRRDGAARVYWLTIPTPRSGDLEKITRAVNAAIDVASVPWRAQVRVIDLGAVLTPDDRFHSSIEVDGGEEIVREPDGLHLTSKGAELAAEEVLDALRRDFPSLR